MKTKITSSSYKDQRAVTMETDCLRAQFLPEIGAKLASLVYKPLDLEVLIQRPGARYLLQPFDGDYVAGECSGLDDMFPTIDVCYYDRFPWAGTKMADHGEVWSLPWKMTVQGDKIHFAVNGVRFPYCLEKEVHFAGENILRWDYRLTNLSPFELDYVWSAHPMFILEEAAELALPEGVQKFTGTFSMPSTNVTYGDEFSWPQDSFSDGKLRDFRKLQPKSAGLAYKYFIKGKMPEGWCGVKYHQSGFSLYLSFPTAQVPYLGILPNEGGWQDLYNIFLEPCSAPFDRPDAARYRGQVSTLPGNTVREWHLNITLAEGTDYRGADEEGNIGAE